MRSYKQGLFYPTNKDKYKGDANNIVYRSGWEKSVMNWLDLNPDVVQWSSEEFVIPYVCKTDGRPHRYFIDFVVTFRSGIKMLVEVKPDKQVQKPMVAGKKLTQRLVEEVSTYAKNTSKWEAAIAYCEKSGYVFQIWGETALKRLGIKI
jgi:hypothetical protein